MGVIAKSRFVQLATDSNASKASSFNSSAFSLLASYSARNIFVGRYNSDGSYSPPAPINEEAAAAMYDQAKVYLQENGRFNGKGFRPWEMDDQLYAGLDRSEAWWGFEFEQGYSSHEARAEVLGHVWDSWDGVAFDGEGEGRWACEVTFTPQERSKFEDSTAMAMQFMDYIGANPRLMNNTGEAMIGTHFNVSHPRIVTSQQAVAMKSVLNNSLRFTNASEKYDLFGRSTLYSGFYAQQAPTGEVWLEGKLFRTTYDHEEFAKYLKVCAALTAVIEAVLDKWEENNNISIYLAVDNIPSMVETGAEPNIVFLRVVPTLGRPDYCNASIPDVVSEAEVAAPVAVTIIEEDGELYEADDDSDDYCGYCCEECDGPYDDWEENN